MQVFHNSDKIHLHFFLSELFSYLWEIITPQDFNLKMGLLIHDRRFKEVALKFYLDFNRLGGIYWHLLAILLHLSGVTFFLRNH